MSKHIKIECRDQGKKPTNSRVYIFHDENILENLENRFSRPVKFYRAEVLPQVKSHIKETLGIEVENLKFSWSQKAGCSCGCSPGFVIKGMAGQDIFVDVE